MEETAAHTFSKLPREDLEAFAIRAAIQLRLHRNEIAAGNTFLTLLSGFLLGAAVATSGFLFGLGLG